MISFSAKNQTFRNNDEPVLDLKNFFSRRAFDDYFCFHYLKSSLPCFAESVS